MGGAVTGGASSFSRQEGLEGAAAYIVSAVHSRTQAWNWGCSKGRDAVTCRRDAASDYG